GYRHDRPASSLSYANRRRLEIARAMATEPKLLLLDEPTAGMNPKETEELTHLIGRLRSEKGFTIVVIEHDMRVVKGVSDRVLAGNASGKTTTLKTILGYVVPSKGEVRLAGETISGLTTTRIVGRGLSMVPENRRLFASMTVRENLELGAYQRKDRLGIDADLDRVFALFPRLRERLKQKAGTLSGGEQQMVAMGRALMA